MILCACTNACSFYTSVRVRLAGPYNCVRLQVCACMCAYTRVCGQSHCSNVHMRNHVNVSIGTTNSINVHARMHVCPPYMCERMHTCVCSFKLAWTHTGISVQKCMCPQKCLHTQTHVAHMDAFFSKHKFVYGNEVAASFCACTTLQNGVCSRNRVRARILKVLTLTCVCVRTYRCLRMYTCLCAYRYVLARVRAHVSCVRADAFASIRMHMVTQIYRTHAHTRTHKRMCAHRHVSAHTHMCLCMNAHMVVSSCTCLRAHVVCAHVC